MSGSVVPDSSVAPRTAVCQPPLSVGFLYPGIEPASPAWQVDPLPPGPWEAKPQYEVKSLKKIFVQMPSSNEVCSDYSIQIIIHPSTLSIPNTP